MSDLPGAAKTGRPSKPACPWSPDGTSALLAHLQRVTDALERVEAYLRPQHERIGEAVEGTAAALRDVATAAQGILERQDALEQALKARGSL